MPYSVNRMSTFTADFSAMYTPGFLDMIRRGHDWTDRLPNRVSEPIKENMKVLHQDLRWRVIYHQDLNGSSKKETANCLFSSTAVVSKSVDCIGSMAK